MGLGHCEVKEEKQAIAKKESKHGWYNSGPKTSLYLVL